MTSLSQSQPSKRVFHFERSLGNPALRYNSQINTQRKSYYISSCKNSHDVPQWMGRTQSFFQRNKNQKKMYLNPESSFMQVKQTYVYSNKKKVSNESGQFENLRKSRPRNHWQMKQHTFDFQWPVKQTQIKKSQFNSTLRQIRQTKINPFFKYQMPKYGYRQSPLHRQKETPIKIGHSALINSTYVE